MSGIHCRKFHTDDVSVNFIIVNKYYYHLQSRKVCAKPQMSYILKNVRVTVITVAPSDVQSILEIPVTDEIHMKDRNHGLD